MYFNFKNRIFIHKLFLFFPFLLIFCIPLKTYFITLFSAFCHECAHLLTTLIKKEQVLRLFVTPFGFELIASIKNSKNELPVILSGPLFSLAAFFLFLLFGISYWAKINLFLFTVNILPAFPLDGGRILKIFLTKRFGALKGLALLKKISRYTSLLLLLTGVLFQNVWLFSVSFLIIKRLEDYCFYIAISEFQKNLP